MVYRRQGNEVKARELCYNIVQTVIENTYDADLELFHHVLFEVMRRRHQATADDAVCLMSAVCDLVMTFRRLAKRIITIKWRWWCTSSGCCRPGYAFRNCMRP